MWPLATNVSPDNPHITSVTLSCTGSERVYNSWRVPPAQTKDASHFQTARADLDLIRVGIQGVWPFQYTLARWQSIQGGHEHGARKTFRNRWYTWPLPSSSLLHGLSCLSQSPVHTSSVSLVSFLAPTQSLTCPFPQYRLYCSPQKQCSYRFPTSLLTSCSPSQGSFSRTTKQRTLQSTLPSVSSPQY